MKLGDFKIWIESFPEEFDDYNMVFSEEGKLEVEEYVYRTDAPINSAEVDENSKEICLFNERMDKTYEG